MSATCLQLSDRPPPVRQKNFYCGHFFKIIRRAYQQIGLKQKIKITWNPSKYIFLRFRTLCIIFLIQEKRTTPSPHKEVFSFPRYFSTQPITRTQLKSTFYLKSYTCSSRLIRAIKDKAFISVFTVTEILCGIMVKN